jgi:hypothetical protein
LGGSVARRRGIPLMVWLDDEAYAELKARCREEGYALPSECARDLLLKALKSEAPGASIAEASLRRLERRIQDLLNPYTAKLDDIARRIAELYELVESLSEGGQAARPPAAPPAQPAAKPRKPSAIDRLRDEGVFFEEDATWLRSPAKFFQKLEREGAIVFHIHGEHVAVDPDFWRDFVDIIESIEASGLEEAVDLVTEQLGEKAGRLLEKLARAGLAYYDEASGHWRVSERLSVE